MNTTVSTSTDQAPAATGRRGRLYIRVGDRELNRIRSRADKAGMSVSAYVRTRALGDEERGCTISIDAHELRKAFADLKHAGSNLNQCARVLNTFEADEHSAKSAQVATAQVAAAAERINAALSIVRGR